ncbi:heavy metal translocating P-type ATPase [Accumulibacter sp.]|uniref:heavy metal translocating P-type ATPase n=1 Tax=Accumulibacter sp. TaxID=2053492 RepID=UPI00341BBC38
MPSYRPLQSGHAHAGCGHDHRPAHAHAGCGHDHQHAHAHPAATVARQSAPLKVPAGSVRSRLRIAQMDCPTEEALIRKKLDGIDAVHGLDFNLMQRVLTVVHTADSLPDIDAAIRELGMTPTPLTATATATAKAANTSSTTRAHWPLAIAGLLAIAAEVAHWLDMPVVLVAALALAAVAGCGLATYRKGWIALRNGNLNINALMSIAVTGALLIGQWPEAAMVMFLFTVAELIEARSLDRARHAIHGLLQLAPEQAMVQQADGEWVAVDAATVAPGSVARVRPGERIALDGVIVSGRSTVNQAPITGESLPVEKGEGDAVFAGTINESGSFAYRVTASADHSTLARIIHAVEEAQGRRAPTQRFVDQFAKVYTPVVFVIALAVAIAPPLLMNGVWYDWIYRALVLLVIACPCALVISTPVTIVSGLATAAHHGILIKGGVYLEQGRQLAWLALDKTGTLTHGKPVQTDFELRGALPEEQARRLAASLAARSDHPVSRALTQAEAQATLPRMSVSNFAAIPGRGVQGVIDGVAYQLGNHRLIHDLGVCSPELEARLDALERQGKTTLLLTDGETVLALFAVADSVRDNSRAAIAELHSLGIRTLMLSGDNPHTVAAIAAQVGIDEVRGDQLPEDKAAAISAKLAATGKVGMVGDGINDAPALARADIGFAMAAAGSDTAIETADVALMDDDLRKIARFVRLSRATYRVLVQNIALALGIKGVFLALTVAGLGTMWMAVFADMGTSLLVVFNGLRLLRK